MMFEKPLYLLLILLVIPALVVVVSRFMRTMPLFASKEGARDKNSIFSTIKVRFFVRVLLWALAFACLVIALSKPYWGTKPVATQKNGCSASFVFDVSYSMLAPDTQSATQSVITRLAAASEYASQLLSRMGGMSVSVVLAKGSGVLAVPLTDDFTGIAPLLASLSPTLLTSAGTDLASGVEAAVRSFPPGSAKTSSIVLFTDGDETISSLKAAVMAAVDYGISVVIVGFGSTKETEIVTGDGVRTAKTALREAELQKTCKEAAAVCGKKYGEAAKERICYVNAADIGSILTVLKTVSFNTYGKNGAAGDIVLYEEKPIPRANFFMVLSLALFVVGFTVNEWNAIGKKNADSYSVPNDSNREASAKLNGANGTDKYRGAQQKRAGKTKNAVKAGAGLLVVLFLTSCNAQTKTAGAVLSGVLYWSTDDYQKAADAFGRAEHLARISDDEAALPYARYGLSSAYLMQNDSAAALEALALLPTDSPPLVQFGALYNSGIIAYRAGDFARAAERFKKALLVDSTNRNAKINLELSMNKLNVQTQQGASVSSPINETPAVDSATQAEVFSIIREQEQNQWKNREKQQDSAVLDY